MLTLRLFLSLVARRFFEREVKYDERVTLLLPARLTYSASVYIDLLRLAAIEVEEVWSLGKSQKSFALGRRIIDVSAQSIDLTKAPNAIVFVSETCDEESANFEEVREHMDKEGIPFLRLSETSSYLDVAARENLSPRRVWEAMFRAPIELGLDVEDSVLEFSDPILVTGGAGSIGSTIVITLLDAGFKNVHVLDNSELGIYKLRSLIQSTDLQLHLLDLKDYDQVERLMRKVEPVAVFNAAACKHVDIVEENQDIAFQTNFQGTLNLLRAVDSSLLKSFTLISTDKAVNPANFMGATKRMAELAVRSEAERLGLADQTRFTVVRFGNVFGSSGSAPLRFIDQILSGSRVTLTDPRMERYFMSIQEACYLVIRSSLWADFKLLEDRGPVATCVLDMGESIKIIELIKTMARLAGKRIVSEARGARELQIDVTGLRPGEKLYEELSHNNNLLDTSEPKVKQVPAQKWEDIDLDKEFVAVMEHEKDTLRMFIDKFYQQLDSKTTGLERLTLD